MASKSEQRRAPIQEKEQLSHMELQIGLRQKTDWETDDNRAIQAEKW